MYIGLLDLILLSLYMIYCLCHSIHKDYCKVVYIHLLYYYIAKKHHVQCCTHMNLALDTGMLYQHSPRELLFIYLYM